jgi:FMN-dependent NADH-azoreductase
MKIMGKLLYIIANSKPEEISSSRIVSRELVNRIMKKHPDLVLEELDLYQEYIPRPQYKYFSSRSTLASGEELLKLSSQEQKDIQEMLKLCKQFVEASVYVVASPMWSLSFPAVLKDYIDCVMQADHTITFENEKPKGLLDDRPRTFIYVQSSGANIPWILKPVMDKGLNYVEDIIKFTGISKFEELLVDGTGTTDEEKGEAIEKAKNKIDSIIDDIEV